MVNLVGGYDSIGFALLVLGLLSLGSILNAVGNIVLRAIGLGLFIYGGVLLLGLIDFTIDTTPNLPSFAGAFPPLFVAILLIVVFKMMSSSYPKERKSSSTSKTITEAKKQ